jgi:hypothetical protein
MVTQSTFLQNKIAVIWDFDKTLIPGHMQGPLFAHYGVDEDTFWKETNGYKEFFAKSGLTQFSSDSYYLLHILTYVRAGRFKGLNNELLRKLGNDLVLCPGLPQFFGTVRSLINEDRSFRLHDIQVEHYIVSNGLRQMILGSPIGSLATEVWGCEFVESLPQPGYLSVHEQESPDLDQEIKAVGYQIDNTSKTRAIFEINKGSRFHNIDVNDTIPYEFRRIPFQNMVYIADGKSDVPVFSILNQYQGRTFAVYDPQKHESFAEVNGLLKQGRVDCIGPADYSKGTQAWYWILDAVRDVAQQIVHNWDASIEERVGRAPSYAVVAPAEAVPLMTQEAILEVVQNRGGEGIGVDHAQASQQRPLIDLPAPVDLGTTVGVPRELLSALDEVSDRYKPISDEERAQLLVLIRNRSAARSSGARGRRSPSDREVTTARELEGYLDQMRGAAPQAGPAKAP